MNPPFAPGLKRLFALSLGGLLLCLCQSSAPAAVPPFDPGPEYQPAAGEFDFVGKAVVQLLQTKDASGFATNLAVNAQNWRSLITTNLPPKEAERLESYARGADHTAQQLEESAKALLSRADSLHLDFSKGDLQCQVVAPKHVGKIYFANPRDGGLTAPYLEKLEIILNPAAPEAGQTNQGEFKLSVRGLEKFPGGWHINGSVQWTAFPTNVVDEKTVREMAIMEKIAAHKGISSQDDPLLLKLGESLVHFVQTADTNLFAKEALIDADQVWAMFKKSGQKGPSRQEVDEEIGKQNQAQLASARKTLQLMTEAGIDLKQADIQIKEASVDRCQAQGPAGTLDNLMGEQFKLALSVKTAAKARNGAGLAGDYVLAVKMVAKMEGSWRVMDDVHWEKLPGGVVDDKAMAAMKFENHVAEHGTLPLQTSAPEIEFTTLVGEKKMQLSDLRGKVVILDFWATWCGPCQEPMAELQTLRSGHTNWQDKVAIVPLSIDDALADVRKHVDQRGWTNTFNVWAGEGGWHSAPAQTFRVTGVPTTYVIDAQGKIVWAGHPAGADFGKMIDRLLQH